jgi:hypothetical protein
LLKKKKKEEEDKPFTSTKGAKGMFSTPISFVGMAGQMEDGRRGSFHLVEASLLCVLILINNF